MDRESFIEFNLIRQQKAHVACVLRSQASWLILCIYLLWEWAVGNRSFLMAFISLFPARDEPQRLPGQIQYDHLHTQRKYLEKQILAYFL